MVDLKGIWCQTKLQIHFLKQGMSREVAWEWARAWIQQLGTEEFKKIVTEWCIENEKNRTLKHKKYSVKVKHETD